MIDKSEPLVHILSKYLTPHQHYHCHYFQTEINGIEAESVGTG